MAVLLSLAVVVGVGGGCAWLEGKMGRLPAVQVERPVADALPEPADPGVQASRRTPHRYEARDPFSRRMATRYRAATAATAGEAGALMAQEPEVAEILAEATAEGEADAEGLAAALPAVGAGPEEGDGRSRRALWLAMALVVAIGVSAMWLARRQSRA